MTVTAILEKLNDQRYRATITQPFPMESEGRTVDEAMNQLREMAVEKLKSSQMVELQLPDVTTDNPWVRMAGMWKDHPDFDQYLENIKEYRREVDARE